MPDYVVFLRAVNLGRTRKLPMADARAWLADAGFADVETYIQTGNVRVSTRIRSTPAVERAVEEALEAGCGFEVPAIARTPGQLRQAYDDALGLPTLLDADARRYVTFLKREPSAEAAAAVDAFSRDGEAARVVGQDVHVWLAKPSHTARIGNAWLERTLGPATTRDLKVVTTLAERWGQGPRGRRG